MRAAILVLCTWVAMGCTVVTKPGDFQSAAHRDLVLDMTNMVPHVHQTVVVDLVSNHNNDEVRAIIDPLGDTHYRLVVPHAVVAPPYQLDFYADVDGNGAYTPPMGTFIDHSWRYPLFPGPEAFPLSGELDFVHNTNFTDLTMPKSNPIGDTVDLTFVGFESFVSKIAELRIETTDSTTRTVILYRFNSFPDQHSFTKTVEHILDDGSEFNVKLWIDANGDGMYEPPPTDEGFLRSLTAQDRSVVMFDHSMGPGTDDVHF